MRYLTLLLVLLAVVTATQVGAQGYKIDWYSINSGGGVSTGGNYRLNCTIGQPVAGLVSGANILHWIGFWAGDVPTPVVVNSLDEAKRLPDGTFVSVSGQVATSAADDFGTFFYAEDPDRVSGIRVSVPAPVANLVRGSIVNIVGTLSTTASGERQFTGPMVVIVGTQTPLAPVGLTNRALGGGDLGEPPLGQYGVAGGSGLNNIGILVHTWGLITETGAGYVMIDDGSGPVRVDTTTLATPPTSGYISVIGISSLYQATPGGERTRLVLPRKQGDIAPH